MSSEYVLGTPSLYAAGELQVRLDVDEANDSTLTFTDKEERTVLVRLRSGGVSHDTYYAYNDYGLLCCVLPPAAEGRTDAASLARYAYRYCYDSRDRCIEKQFPGCDPVRYVYDRADRLVLEQDGVQRAGNRWTVHKYDGQGRLLYSYEHTDATPVATLRETLKSRCVTERYTGTGGLGIGYTHTSLADGSDLRLLVVNYYDDYRFLNLLDASTRSSLVYAALSGYDARHPSACGQLTGTRSYVADAGGQYIASAIYYDAKGRPVQQHTTTLRGGYERSWLQYRFAGGVQRLRRHHYDPSGGNLVSSYRYAYDSCERLTAVYHTLGDGQEVCLSTLSYDAYGRLGRRTLHGGIHSSTYSYNIRDWLTGISGPKFTQNLYYNTGSGTPCWNGNISSMTWQAGSESTLRGYKFAYDGLNRLTAATYGEGTSLTASPNRYTEKVTGYDKNGNILALQRYGQTAASTYGLIDNLTLSYDGNRLTRADDAVTASAYGGGFEFKDAVKQANEYTYDANGNLTKDLNKNISSIQYNSLNLPSIVTFGDGSTITYTYTADGTKLRTVHQIGGTTTTTDYCGDVIYENGVRKLLLTEAGYVTLADNRYHYYLQDHQGNNRVVLSQTGTVEEVNHYYPFGGVFASTGNVQPYKYNGKELDAKKGLNWYDYGARHYDAALGRFLTVDPMAEKFYPWSPYGYCYNNPVKHIDENGEFPLLPNIVGGGLAALFEYGAQVASNLVYDFSFSAFTHVDIADIGTAAIEGFLTSGRSIVKNAMARTTIGVGTIVVQSAVNVEISSTGLEATVNSVPEIVGNTVIGLIGSQIKTDRKLNVMETRSSNATVSQVRQRMHDKGEGLSTSEAKQIQSQNGARNEMVKEVNQTVSDAVNGVVGNTTSAITQKSISEELDLKK